jgi:hypothetical protein
MFTAPVLEGGFPCRHVFLLLKPVQLNSKQYSKQLGRESSLLRPLAASEARPKNVENRRLLYESNQKLTGSRKVEDRR